jgi:hypothetical protein
MKIKTVILCFFGLLNSDFYTQSSSNHDTYLGIGSGRRTIASTEKQQQMPSTMDSVIDLSEIKYYVEPKKHLVDFNAVPIRPASLKVVEPLEKLYPGYIKGAAGTYLMPYLEVYYNSTRSKNNNWGISGLHHSALGGIKDVGVNKFSDNKIGGFYKHFLMKQDLQVDLNYERNAYHYYGFKPDSLLIPIEYSDPENDDTTKQIYNLLEFSGLFKSRNLGRDTNRLNYEGKLNYHYLNSKAGTRENYVLVGFDFGKFLNKEEFLGTFSVDINHLDQAQWIKPDSSWEQQDNIQSTSAIVKLNPHIYSRAKNWQVKAGLGLHSNITHEAKFYFYPDLECSYSLFNDLFIPYLGIKGGIERVNMNKIRIENPFVSDDAEILNMNNRTHIFGGIRGSLSANMTFNVSASFDKFGSKNGDNGMYFFIPDTLSSYENKFSIIYDKMDQTSLVGQLSYAKGEKLKLYGKGEFFIYSPTTEEYAWQMPNYRFTISAWYDIADKIIVKGDVFLIGNRKVFSYNEPIDNEYEFINNRYIYSLKPFLDMNLGIEYRYNKRISAFINFNNFTASNYQRWSSFPVQSINIFGGATFSF